MDDIYAATPTILCPYHDTVGSIVHFNGHYGGAHLLTERATCGRCVGLFSG